MRTILPIAVVMLAATPAAATITVPAKPISFTLPVSGGPVQQFGIGFNGFVDGVAEPALAANLILRLNSVSSAGRTWSFTATASNVSDASLLTSARLSAVGFSTARSPGALGFLQISGITTIGTVFTTIAANNAGGVAIPGLSPSPQLCFKGGGGRDNCSGAGGNGVALNGSHSFPFSLSFASGLTSLTLHNFVARYQSINGTSAATGAAFVDASGVGYADVVPEPASWAMLVAGFGLVGAALRRRQPALGPALA